MQKIVVFRLEDLEIVREILTHVNANYKDAADKLEKLGYIKESSVGDDYEAMVFASIFLAYRRRNHYKGQTLITPASSQWTLLRRVSEEAVEFIEKFDTPMREGFVTFLELAQDLGWTDLRELRYKVGKIIEEQEANNFLDADPNSATTDLVLDAYTKEIVSRTGYVHGVKTAKDYAPFIKAAAICVSHKITPMTYIQYLFEKWEWAGVLKPSQLHGDKAEEYLRDWDSSQPIPQRKIKKVTLKRGAARW